MNTGSEKEPRPLTHSGLDEGISCSSTSSRPLESQSSESTALHTPLVRPHHQQQHQHQQHQPLPQPPPLAGDALEIMSRQATINVGTIGHVAHGKSTVVRAISGVKTQKHRHELMLQVTINLGYANAKLFRCPQCPRPQCYRSFGSSQADETACPACGAPMKLLRHLSFVDCPGHGTLMSTMLNGAAVMDAALLLIAADETFPQPQTLEHLAAAELSGIAHLIVLQSKMDRVEPAAAAAQHAQIKRYLERHTRYRDAPVIPISALRGGGIDYLLEYLCRLPLPPRPPVAAAFVPVGMRVLRSFDVTLPAVGVEGLRGGVLGGTLTPGAALAVGDEVELLPGLMAVPSPGYQGSGPAVPTRRSVLCGQSPSYLVSPPPGPVYCVPLRTKVVELRSEAQALPYAVAGGLVAVGTTLDPALTRQNKLSCQSLRVVARAGQSQPLLPPAELEAQTFVYYEVDIHYRMLDHLLGMHETVGAAYCDDGSGSGHHHHHHHLRCHAPCAERGYAGPGRRGRQVAPLQRGERVIVHLGNHRTHASVLRCGCESSVARLLLESPVVCQAARGDRVLLCRLVAQRLRLVGWGKVMSGKKVQML